MLNLALLIIGASSFFSMNHVEKKVLYTINNRRWERNAKVLGAIVIQRFWRSCATVNNPMVPLVQHTQHALDYRFAQAIREFRDYKRSKPKLEMSTEVLILDIYQTTA